MRRRPDEKKGGKSKLEDRSPRQLVEGALGGRRRGDDGEFFESSQTFK